VAAVRDGAFQAEDYGPLSHLGVGGCSIAPMNPDLVPAAVIEQVKAKEAAIRAGELKVKVDDSEPKSTR
jgi:hypothetical protein